MARKSKYVDGKRDKKVRLPIYLLEHFEAKEGFNFSEFFGEKLEEEYLKEKTAVDVAKNKRKR